MFQDQATELRHELLAAKQCGVPASIPAAVQPLAQAKGGFMPFTEVGCALNDGVGNEEGAKWVN